MDAARPQKRSPALEGAQLVFRSGYLISIVAIVGLYEIVSTVMDFQFTATVAHYLKGDAIGRQITTVYAFTNGVALVVQLVFTSFVMTRFGVSAALLVLPLAALSGSAAFLAAPTLTIGSLLNTADNAFSYSINQSAKEALYVPTTRDEKYKAKAFIDMFVQRFAKALAVGVSLFLTIRFDEFATVRWLSVFTAMMIAVWAWAALYAGRRFRDVTDSPERRP
jgi:AAA family ATP:ADP antiporter